MKNQNTSLSPRSELKLFSEDVIADIEKYVKLNPNDRALILPMLQRRSFLKKEVIMEKGTVCQNIYFVNSGYICLQAINVKGTISVLQFGLPGWWLTDFSSFDSMALSHYQIESIERSELTFITKANYQYLNESVPAFERYMRLILQKKYASSIKKLELLMCESAEERFTLLSNIFPKFVQQAPQYVIASVLGFTPQFLSMLRAKLKR